MRIQDLSRHLRRDGFLQGLDLPSEDVIVGVGRDPEDRRRNCIVLYLPPELESAAAPTVPDHMTLDGEQVRVVTRARGGDLIAYPGVQPVSVARAGPQEA